MLYVRSGIWTMLIAGIMCLLASCGGEPSGDIGSVLDNRDSATERVTAGEFSAIRFNETGFRDSNLNTTMRITTSRVGAYTDVTVAVGDSHDMIGVTMELDYDASRYHPVDAEFHGLVDDPIEAYIPNTPGSVGLGQVTSESKTRNGDFVTVTFADGACANVRGVSRVHISLLNDVYDAPQLDSANHAQGFEVTEVGDGSLVVTVNSVFAQGDGDDNAETNVADLSAMVMQGNFTVSVADGNFGPAAIDWDRNGEPNLADIAQIAINNQAVIHHIDFMVSDNPDMTDAVVHEEISFADGVPSNRYPAPFTATSWNGVWRTWTSPVTAAETSIYDANWDGLIYLSARTSDGFADGDVFTPGVEVQDISHQVLVTGVDVTLNDTGVSTAEAIPMIANSSDTWDITGISGEYDDGEAVVPFTAEDAGAVVPQHLYDKALSIVLTNAIWTVTNTGADDEFKFIGPALAMPDPSLGVPISSTTFPDWDVESVAPKTEAILELTFDAAGGKLTDGLAPIEFSIDVEKDPQAPEIGSSMANHGQDASGNWVLSTDSETSITSLVTWGTVPPQNHFDVYVELVSINGKSTTYSIKYTANAEPGPGEFTIIGDFINSRVAPLDEGVIYSLRVSNGNPNTTGVWSSVNVPGVWFTTIQAE